MTATALGLGSSFLLRRAERAADFADMAWIVAQAVGDGVGVRGVEANTDPADGYLHVRVVVNTAEQVREMGDRLGFEVHVTDRQAVSMGFLGPICVVVVRFEPDRAEAVA